MYWYIVVLLVLMSLESLCKIGLLAKGKYPRQVEAAEDFFNVVVTLGLIAGGIWVLK
jgi:hypothetical protein